MRALPGLVGLALLLADFSGACLAGEAAAPKATFAFTLKDAAPLASAGIFPPQCDSPHRAAFFLLVPGSSRLYARLIERLDTERSTPGGPRSHLPRSQRTTALLRRLSRFRKGTGGATALAQDTSQ